MFQKGNTYAAGKKSGGRKTIKQEIQEATEMITQDALIKLANSKVYKQLVALQDFKDTKEMALPITLRGIIERKELSGKDGQPLIIQFDESFNKRNEPTGKSEN